MPLPTIDQFMRSLKVGIDNHWYSQDADAEDEKVHQRSNRVAHCMTFDLIHLPKEETEELTKNNLMPLAEQIAKSRQVAKWRHIGNLAKKSPADCEYWGRPRDECPGLRCSRDYDKPLNADGYLRWMIRVGALYDLFPKRMDMRQPETTPCSKEVGRCQDQHPSIIAGSRSSNLREQLAERFPRADGSIAPLV